ncbi:Histone deacetylase hda1 [Entomortierella lignicola]|nr:Histone deacetylase hda1 [Entomortierella lignicola]
MEELHLVHTKDHVEKITKTAGLNKDELLKMANSYNSIYLNNSSAFCARLSCGSLIELCKAVATGQVLNGLAIIRPPGHHAEPHEAGGFCLYNNVAIAARYLQNAHGLRKIFILDWDVHHGNGTQTVFYDDPDVVYCSIHRFDHGEFYPGDPVAAAHTAIGEGKGRGSGMGDSEYIYAFNKVIMPIVLEFAPDFVLVSAGFDAAKGDHIGQMLVTPPAYGHMTHMLKSLAGGKIILALEGGYNLDSIAVSGLACAQALLNDPIEPLGPITPNALCVQTIHEVIEVQSRYWKSLPQVYIDSDEEPVEGRLDVSINKVLGVYREEYLRERYDMIKMPKLESENGKGTQFLENVYCTQQTYNSKPLGEFCTRIMSTNNIVRPEKSFLMDSVSHYVDHIIGSDNELIDIVQPYQPTCEEEKVALKEKLSGLLLEIWDSYVATTGYTGRRIILLATGFGCHGMVAFMNERQREVNRPSGRLSDLLNHLRKRIFEDIDRKLEGLPPVNPDDDSDLESTKDGPVPMETDPNPTTTAPPTQQNGKLSNQFNGDIKPIPTSPMEESQLTPIPRINEDQGVVTTKATTKMEELSPNQSPRSYPGSPLLNGSSILRPISQPLVDRPSVVGQQHRSQPYPSPNGRPYNSPVMNPSTSSSPSSSSAGPLPTHLKGSTPQGRGSDPKLTGLGPGSGGEPTEHQIRVAEQQQQQFLEEQRHLEKQRLHQQQQQQQQQEQFQQQSRHPQERPDIRGGHPYPPYQGGGGSGGDKRIPRSSGPGEHYAPTPSSNGTAVSPASGSPHAPHSSIKPQSHPPQSQHQQQTGPHHPPGFGGVSQGNGSYRQGPPPQSMGPSSGSSAAPSPSSSSFETMHHHRGSYSSQGPPAPVSGPPPMSGPPPVSGPPPISGPTPKPTRMVTATATASTATTTSATHAAAKSCKAWRTRTGSLWTTINISTPASFSAATAAPS